VVSFWYGKRRKLNLPWTESETRAWSVASSGWVHSSFIDQHNRNIVADRIHPPTLVALQAFRVFPCHQRLFASRANQDVEQIFGDHQRHSTPPAPKRGPARVV